MQAELRRRIAEAYAVLRSLQGRVMGAKEVSTPAKGALNKALCYSRMLHNAGSWPPLTEQQELMITKFRIKAWRCEYGCLNAGKLPAERVTDAQ
eukprot:11211541-Lingulodinium_polyedra.AAC.1